MALKNGFPQLLIICCAITFSCSSRKSEGNISIVWQDDKAKALAVPINYFEGTPSDSLHVQLAGQRKQFILGKCSVEKDLVRFEPLVAFTRGLTYEVYVKGKLISTIKIETSTQKQSPELAIYPSADTVPENLLKVYLKFSVPMQEGVALNYVSLIEDERDTLKNVFLDLKPELWNEDGTLLTLWLDPGRIKRDLKPNLSLGAPLTQNKNYTLVVSPDWRSSTGNPLDRAVTKHFVTSIRDERITNINEWKIIEPENTADQLQIDFNEPLDYSLITKTIVVADDKGNRVPGSIQIGDHEQAAFFTPTQPWQKGNYEIVVESRLEDLAGNNLARPFDRDLKKSSTPTRQVFERQFRIH